MTKLRDDGRRVRFRNVPPGARIPVTAENVVECLFMVNTEQQDRLETLLVNGTLDFVGAKGKLTFRTPSELDSFLASFS